MAVGGNKTVWDGVYTEAQAQRGRAVYSQYCIRCHKDDLLGIEGALKGELFMERRREDSIEGLFLDIKATMPRGNPGGLPDQTYADIISFILKSNDMPAGSAELTPTALASIDVVGEGGAEAGAEFRGCVECWMPHTS